LETTAFWFVVGFWRDGESEEEKEEGFEWVRKKNSGWVVESPIEKFSKWVSWVIYCICMTIVKNRPLLCSSAFFLIFQIFCFLIWISFFISIKFVFIFICS
jgi:hypothetical protein